jgi:hypothetical protein
VLSLAFLSPYTSSAPQARHGYLPGLALDIRDTQEAVQDAERRIFLLGRLGTW